MKQTVALLSVLFVALILSSCGVPRKTTYQNFVPKPKHHKVLRVVTYNLNWGYDGKSPFNPASTLKAIKALQADIIFLQETTPAWQKITRKYLKRYYPYQRYAHIPHGGGLGMLSRYPIHVKRQIPSAVKWYPAWLVWIRTPLGKIQFVNIHLVPTMTPHDTGGLPKISLFKTALARGKEIKQIYQQLNPRLPIIIAGDFNEGNDGQAAQFLRAQGLTDAILYVRPRTYTWRWRAGPIVLAYRFDRLYFTPHALHMIKAQILQEGGSDHYPLVVDFTKSS